ncbi:guanine nucleotide-binding protein subunit alpha [Crucibulum laeve]|uniref:Guanine nucleotide-binding protein subunit alpha n=1 Tax=Crucibulum laeve TaxID=68775 RepID=A0A5C3LQE0_9AGAR|nr:guanine nucleotide-binding protein subunit alpha [Crucibulum laeve]
MGCVQSSVDAEALDNISTSKEVKMLLLGTGESGKILYENHIDGDTAWFKEIIVSNVNTSMRNILQALPGLGLTILPESMVHVGTLYYPGSLYELSQDTAIAVRQLWADPAVKEAVRLSHQFYLIDSAPYFFDSIDRISKPNYVPTLEDALRIQVTTTGINKTTFHTGDVIYNVFDVGGQRSERKKWRHCFEDVSVVLLFISLSEYDQTLYEDTSTNRLKESLHLADSIINSRWFVNSHIVLLLNKIDLFAQKLSYSPLSNYFPDYTGGDNYDLACDYIVHRFRSLDTRPSQGRQIHTHFLMSTDTQRVQEILSTIQEMVLKNDVGNMALL